MVRPVTFATIDEQKREIDAYRPFSVHVTTQLREYFRIGLTYASNALEGNSLTESETKIVIEDGITVAGKPLRHHLEALGHSNAYDFLLSIANGATITEDQILELHRLFYFRIDEANAGVYRNVQVLIAGSNAVLPPPSQVEPMMKALGARFSSLRSGYHAVEFAATHHIEFVNIHPFVDGNGRTARLLVNLALLQAGYGIAVIPPVLRPRYLDVTAHANKGETKPFIDFLTNVVWESQKDYLRLLRALNEP